MENAKLKPKRSEEEGEDEGQSELEELRQHLHQVEKRELNAG